MSQPQLILLPPSEGKAPGGSGKWKPASGVFRSLNSERELVTTALVEAMADETVAQRLLGLKSDAFAQARSTNASVLSGMKLPAYDRYTGVVWAHLQQHLPPVALQRAEEQVVVVTGLLGVVAWADPVPDYKLKIGANLPGVGNLANYWRAFNTVALRKRYRRATVVDLLPNEHRKAVNIDGIGGPVVSVAFVDKNKAAVGHNAKAAKGLFAAHVLEVGNVFDAAVSFEGHGWTGTVHDGQVIITAP